MADAAYQTAYESALRYAAVPDRLPEEAVAVYPTEHLIPETHYLPDVSSYNLPHPPLDYIFVRKGSSWYQSTEDPNKYYAKPLLKEGREAWEHRWPSEGFENEPSVGDLRNLLMPYTLPKPVIEPEPAPIYPADEAAKRFKDRVRLTPEELRADPAFAALAWDAAHNDQQYTRELLQWESKPVVMEAMRWFQERVAQERAAEARRTKRREDRVRPLTDALSDAYEAAGYRTAKQGHDLNIEIDPNQPPAATAAMQRGRPYSSRVTFPKMTSVHTLRVRPDWLSRVHSLGLSSFGGNLVIHAEPAGYTPKGDDVHDIRVVKQGAGTNLKTETVRVARRITPDGSQVLGVRKYKGPVVNGKELRKKWNFYPKAPLGLLLEYLEEIGVRKPLD